MVYSFEPVPPALAADKARHVLGAGGNLWTEFFPNYAHVQYMTYPRACAMAEVDLVRCETKELGRFLPPAAGASEAAEGRGVNFRPTAIIP